MTKKELSAREMASMGGKARAAKLTPERRKEIAAQGGAKKAANKAAKGILDNPLASK